MSATSELHHDQQPEPERPYTMDEWVKVRHDAACGMWRDLNIVMPYNTAWRIADAVLRYAMPDRVPAEGNQ